MAEPLSAHATIMYMKITSEADVEKLVRSDPWMMKVLAAAEELNLPDWWIGAGFLRNKIWDAMEEVSNYDRTDVDLVYLDPIDLTPESENAYDKVLGRLFPDAKWETCNQARMHPYHNDAPYNSTAEAVARWVETATCVAVRKRGGRLEFLWCHGMEDVINMVARPIRHDETKEPELLEFFRKRVAEKHWKERWPHLVVKED